MTTTIHIPNGAEEITAVTLTTILREGGVIGRERPFTPYPTYLAPFVTMYPKGRVL